MAVVNPGTVVLATGQKVRNLEVTVLQPDGSTPTIEMQVVAITDKQGNVIDLSGLSGVLYAILDKLEEVRLEAEMRG